MAYELPDQEFRHLQVVTAGEMNALRDALRYLKGQYVVPDTAIELEAPLRYVNLSTEQRDSLATQEPGSTIWNTTTEAVEHWNGSQWITGGAGGTGSPFHLHDDVPESKRVIYSKDRFLLSDEFNPYELVDPEREWDYPNRHIEFSDLKRQIELKIWDQPNSESIDLRDRLGIGKHGVTGNPNHSITLNALKDWVADAVGADSFEIHYDVVPSKSTPFGNDRFVLSDEDVGPPGDPDAAAFTYPNYYFTASNLISWVIDEWDFPPDPVPLGDHQASSFDFLLVRTNRAVRRMRFFEFADWLGGQLSAPDTHLTPIDPKDELYAFDASKADAPRNLRLDALSTWMALSPQFVGTSKTNLEDNDSQTGLGGDRFPVIATSAETGLPVSRHYASLSTLKEEIGFKFPTVQLRTPIGTEQLYLKAGVTPSFMHLADIKGYVSADLNQPKTELSPIAGDDLALIFDNSVTGVPPRHLALSKLAAWLVLRPEFIGTFKARLESDDAITGRGGDRFVLYETDDDDARVTGRKYTNLKGFADAIGFKFPTTPIRTTGLTGNEKLYLQDGTTPRQVSLTGLRAYMGDHLLAPDAEVSPLGGTDRIFMFGAAPNGVPYTLTLNAMAKWVALASALVGTQKTGVDDTDRFMIYEEDDDRPGVLTRKYIQYQHFKSSASFSFPTNRLRTIAPADDRLVVRDATDSSLKYWSLNGLLSWMRSAWPAPDSEISPLGGNDRVMMYGAAPNGAAYSLTLSALAKWMVLAPNFIGQQKTSLDDNDRFAFYEEDDDRPGVLTRKYIQSQHLKSALSFSFPTTELLRSQVIGSERLHLQTGGRDRYIQFRTFRTWLGETLEPPDPRTSVITNNDTVMMFGQNANLTPYIFTLANLAKWLVLSSNFVGSQKSSLDTDDRVSLYESDRFGNLTKRYIEIDDFKQALGIAPGFSFPTTGLSPVSSLDRLLIQDRTNNSLRYYNLNNLRNWLGANFQWVLRGSISTPATDDYFLIMDRSDTPDSVKSISLANMKKALGGNASNFVFPTSNLDPVSSLDRLMVQDRTDNSLKYYNLSSLRTWLGSNFQWVLRGSISTPALDDYFLIMDRSDSPDSIKSISLANMKKAVGGAGTGNFSWPTGTFGYSNFNIGDDLLLRDGSTIRSTDLNQLRLWLMLSGLNIASLFSIPINSTGGSDQLWISDNGINRSITLSRLATWLVKELPVPTTSLTDLADTDKIPIYDDDVTGDPLKYTTFSNLKAKIGGGGGSAFSISGLTNVAPDAFFLSDSLALADANDSQKNKKMLVTNFIRGVGDYFSRATRGQKTAPTDNDSLVIFDNAVTGSPLKYVRLSNLKSYIGTGGSTTIISGGGTPAVPTSRLSSGALSDRVPIFDISDGNAYKYVRFSDMSTYGVYNWNSLVSQVTSSQTRQDELYLLAWNTTRNRVEKVRASRV